MVTIAERSLKQDLIRLGKGEISARDLLFELKEKELEGYLSNRFEQTATEVPSGRGECILPGDVSGQLVLNRETAEELLLEAKRRKTGIDLIYSIEQGNLEDFYVLSSSKGFFTSQKGRTTFCPVQASCEGVPTLVNVDCRYHQAAENHTLRYVFHDGSEIELVAPKRWIQFENSRDQIAESDFVSISASRGEIFHKSLTFSESIINRLYTLLSEAYLEAIEIHGPSRAQHHINETSVFQQHKEEILEILHTDEFKGFQKLLQEAHKVSHLKVFSTSHTSKMMALTKLYGSDIEAEGDTVRITSHAERYGLGLLRDERMWNQPQHIDLMRLVFLGPDILGAERYDHYYKLYLKVFTEKVYDVLKVGTGQAAVVRLLCMPLNMIFADDFNAKNFSAHYELDLKKVKDRVNVLAGETETYHGCRGVRITVQREDICKLWCEGVIDAAQKAYEQGIDIRLQILLAMVTFPQEVRMFIDTFERTLEEKGIDPDDFVRGISVMIETSGAYHLSEEILNERGKQVEVNGCLFGGNDFTAACLNMNRADAAQSIIPGYIRLQILPHSPFQHLNTQVVGKAIRQVLRKTSLIRKDNHRDYLMGLGGEVAGSWETVQWLSDHAEPLGLKYVTTPPGRLLFSLFASAQSSVHSTYK